MAKKNKETLRRFIDEAWNKNNPAICDELLTPEFRHYMPGSKEPVVGPEGYKQLLAMFRTAFGRRRMDIEEIFGEKSQICVRWTFRGVHRGEYDGVAPTRRKIRVDGVAVARVRKGKIEEVHSVFDTASLRAALTAAD